MIKSGFWNSLNGDRKYNAEAFSEILSCLITDGVCIKNGSDNISMYCTPLTDKPGINILPGSCWYNGIYTKIFGSGEQILFDPIYRVVGNNNPSARHDYVYLTVDKRLGVRSTYFVVSKGAQNIFPVVDPDVYYNLFVEVIVYPENNIVSVIKRFDYVYGLSYESSVFLAWYGQKEAELNNLISSKTEEIQNTLHNLYISESSFNEFIQARQNNVLGWENDFESSLETARDNLVSEKGSEFDTWSAGFQNGAVTDVNALKTAIRSESDAIKAELQSSFNEWFEHIRDELSSNQAGNLQNQIDINYDGLSIVDGKICVTYETESENFPG